MLTNIEKIKIINDRIDRLQEIFILTGQYINLISSGMEDPDVTINQCNKRIQDFPLKIEALKMEKALLSSKQPVV